jgi:hypothetical protein
MAVLRNGSKCSHTACMLRFITVSRLALNPNLFFEIGSKVFLKGSNLLPLFHYCLLTELYFYDFQTKLFTEPQDNLK